MHVSEPKVADEEGRHLNTKSVYTIVFEICAWKCFNNLLNKSPKGPGVSLIESYLLVKLRALNDLS